MQARLEKCVYVHVCVCLCAPVKKLIWRRKENLTVQSRSRAELNRRAKAPVYTMSFLGPVYTMLRSETIASLLRCSQSCTRQQVTTEGENLKQSH